MERGIRRPVAALLVAVGVVALTSASAASLGGLTRRPLGADRGAVASCDTNGMTLTPGTPTYNPAGRRYVVRRVVVTGIAAACNGRRIRITVASASGSAITSGTALITAPSTTVTFAANANIKALVKVAVVAS